MAAAKDVETLHLRVTGLHKLPFDPAAFEREMDSLRNHSARLREELRGQFLENWQNAWIVIVEWNGPPEEVNFGRFGHGDDPDPATRQAAWLEQVLESTPERTRAAFFLHYVDTRLPLFYGDEALTFPAPSSANLTLVEMMQYASPD